MAKADLGTKRLCPNCGAKYYDLHRSPITCPRCGTRFEPMHVARSRQAAAVVPDEEEIEEVEIPADAELISLEEADEEVAGPADEDEEIVATEEVEEDTFLEPDDEAEDDVTDIIGDVDEEER